MGRKTRINSNPRAAARSFRSRNGYEERLSERGVSVYRPVVPGQLEPAMQVLGDLCSDKVIIRRGDLHEKPPGVSLLTLSILKSNRELFSELQVQEAINEIYGQVPSVRRKLKLGLGQIGIFGNSNTPVAVIAYAFDEESAEVLREERLQIIDVLGSLATINAPLSYADSYPHISLARMHRSNARNIGAVAWHHLQKAMPQEITLGRAVLNNPS